MGIGNGYNFTISCVGMVQVMLTYKDFAELNDFVRNASRKEVRYFNLNRFMRDVISESANFMLELNNLTLEMPILRRFDTLTWNMFQNQDSEDYKVEKEKFDKFYPDFVAVYEKAKEFFGDYETQENREIRISKDNWESIYSIKDWLDYDVTIKQIIMYNYIDAFMRYKLENGYYKIQLVEVDK